ncbi:MAG: orotidine-5'-phosphate decarboxylase [Verrucomicrobiales bacterium]
MNTREDIIIALDFVSAREAEILVETLGDSAGFYKVGLQLLTAAGPSVIRALAEADKKVFLDLKLHEIPNSVMGGVRAAGQLGASMVTVHGSGGSAVLQAAAKASREFPDLKVLAVTVVTSMTDADLREIGVDTPVEQQVLRLAALALEAGCHGVIASPQQAKPLRDALPAGALIVTPGTRMPSDAGTDQVRVATPGEAIQAGASHVVVGRAISKSDDPLGALSAIAVDIDQSRTR